MSRMIRSSNLSKHSRQLPPRRDSKNKQSVEGIGSPNQLGIYTVVAITLYVTLRRWPDHWTITKLCGAFILIPSEALWIAARLHLGASFSGKAEARALITDGIYTHIQNPIYLFSLLTLAGFFLFMDWKWAFLTLPPVIGLQTLRVRRERVVLTAAFGDAYTTYRQKTWF